MEPNKLRTAIGLILSTSLGNRQIGRELEMAYNTVRRYRQVARERAFGLEELQATTDDALQTKFQGRTPRNAEKRVPDWTHVHRELHRKGVTRTLLWMEYREEDPATAYELSRFNELYVEWAGKQASSMRQHHEPGERGWTDFSGTTMQWVEPMTGEIHGVEIFVAALGVSSLLFAIAVPSQRQEHWIHAHCEWYAFLGGVPKITVPDNLKSAVLKPGREPRLNPAYLDMGRHYNTYILPARSGKPKDKSKAEGGVLLFLRWGIARLRNRVFHSLAELNRAISESVELINHRMVRHFKQSRSERFTAIDKPHLQLLPVRYEYGEWVGPLRVAPDYHVAVKGHFYSVPYRLVQQSVHARCTLTTVEIMCDGKRIASHLRSEKVGEKTTERSHMPEHHLAWADHTPGRYQEWARGVGQPVLTVVESMLASARHPAGALNACVSLQKLCRTHGQERFVLACSKALAIQSPTVKSIRSILQNHLERRADPTGAKPQLPVHGNVRGASYYQTEETAHAG
jgi:transposase